MQFSLSYIRDCTEGVFAEGACENKIIKGFFTDSRTPDTEKLFLALKGEKVDGNLFVKTVVSSGCPALTDDISNLSLGGNVIYVEDVRKALRDIAINWRKTEVSGIPFVGITGSVGKTTTKDMVATALSASLKVRKTVGNANSQLGLPQTVLSVEKDDDIAVVELGMSLFGEMERIAECARPDISVVTNIGHSHIENLLTRENIRNEKLKITSFSKDNSILVLNGDEPLLREVNIPKRRIFFVSESDKTADAYAEDVNISAEGITFKAFVFGENINVSLSVIGKHYVINSLFALAVAKLSGVALKNAAEKLSAYQSDGKRQFITEKNGYTVISDCYNASPESMSAALSVLKTFKTKRIAVLGDMLELGENAAQLHADVASDVDSSADVLVTYGELAKNIAESSALPEKYSFTDKTELKKFLDSYINKGDTVLYKASNGMKLGEVI